MQLFPHSPLSSFSSVIDFVHFSPFRYCRIPICMAQATRCWYSGVQSFSASVLLDKKPHSDSVSYRRT
jgi:hypothetical protein